MIDPCFSPYLTTTDEGESQKMQAFSTQSLVTWNKEVVSVKTTFRSTY